MSNRLLVVSLDGVETFKAVDRVIFRVHDVCTFEQRSGGTITGEQVHVQYDGPYGEEEVIKL
jgi:hypothetical protein